MKQQLTGFHRITLVFTAASSSVYSVVTKSETEGTTDEMMMKAEEERTLHQSALVGT